MNIMKLFFLFVLSFGLTTPAEKIALSPAAEPIFSHKRITRKMIRFRRAMQSHYPLSRLWKAAKFGMAVVGAVGTVCAVAADFGYPLTATYVPAHPSSWKERFAAIALTSIGCLGINLLYNTIDRAYGKKITLAWFVRSHSTFYETIRALYAEIKDAALIDMVPDKDLLKKLYEKLIDQTEEICAYMLRSENMFEQERRLKVNAMRTAFVEKLEVLYADFAQAIEDNAADLIIKLDNITTTVEQTCVRFTAIEGSHWVDPQLIYTMMQSRLSAV